MAGRTELADRLLATSGLERDVILLRADLDAVDRRISVLFAERVALATRLAYVKAQAGLPARDEARENEVVAGYAEACPTRSPAVLGAVQVLGRFVLDVTRQAVPEGGREWLHRAR